MKENIPAGYQLHVTTWENDADAYKTAIISGLTEIDAKFLIEVAKEFGSTNSRPAGLGNRECTFDEMQGAIKAAFAKYPGISKELAEEWIIEVKEEDEDDAIYNVYETLIGILGSPVEYDGMFCRVYSGHKVYFFETEVKDVSSKFK